MHHLFRTKNFSKIEQVRIIYLGHNRAAAVINGASFIKKRSMNHKVVVLVASLGLDADPNHLILHKACPHLPKAEDQLARAFVVRKVPFPSVARAQNLNHSTLQFSKHKNLSVHVGDQRIQ